MSITRDDVLNWLNACGRVLAENKDYLTQLDSDIGDADHGANMDRGFKSVLAKLPTVADKDIGTLFKSVGMTLVSTVGGASGPLYGTLFMTLGKELPADPTRDDFARAANAAIDAVKARGKSDIGQKTMLDVLRPALDAFVAGRDPIAAAQAAAEATIPMRAIRGRASFLGERSIGHMDPGARSSALIIAAVCEVVERA